MRPARAGHLVGQAPMLYGRADDLAAVLSLPVSHSMVTIAGSAGIGKSELGRAIAFELLSGGPDSVWWVELAALTDPSQVAAMVARALGIEPDGLRPTVNVVASACARNVRCSCSTTASTCSTASPTSSRR